MEQQPCAANQMNQSCQPCVMVAPADVSLQPQCFVAYMPVQIASGVPGSQTPEILVCPSGYQYMPVQQPTPWHQSDSSECALDHASTSASEDHLSEGLDEVAACRYTLTSIGNPSVRDLMKAMSVGGAMRDQAVAMLLENGLVRRFAFEAEGCRLVQAALEATDRHTAAELAGGLRGCVAKAVQSRHANFVIQLIIKVLTPQEVPFVIEELAEATLDLARHEYGCRVYCRLIEHAASDPGARWLIDELLVEAEELVRQRYGHHVAECIVEHGLPHQKQQVVSTLRRNLARHLRNRNAVYVIEKGMQFCGDEERKALALDILKQDSADVASLLAGPSCFVLAQAFARQGGAVAQRFQALLEQPMVRSKISSTRLGHRLLKQLESDHM